MKIIIIGDGNVGYSLAEILSKDGNDVTIIDKDEEALNRASKTLDVLCIKGSGVSTSVLIEAGIKQSDLLIAASSSDEINMVCCLTGKKLGAPHTIARIRDPEYANELRLLKKELGLDMVINPEQATANEIARLIKFPAAINVESFAKGHIEMVEIIAMSKMSIIGKKIKDISENSNSVLIGVIERGDEVIIPNGDFVILENDILYIVGHPSKVYTFCKNIGANMQKIRNVMIVGGGRLAYYLAKYLEELEIRSKIVEIDYERTIELTELLPKALIIYGDGADDELLDKENLNDMDAFVSVTDRDEDNLFSALWAKQCGVNKVVTKIERPKYLNMIKNLGLSNVANPIQVITNHISRFVRGLKNAKENPMNSLYILLDGKIEAVEFVADKSTKFLDIPLSELQISKNILVATIKRGNNIIIPHGKDTIKDGDDVILITKDRKIDSLNDIIGFNKILK